MKTSNYRLGKNILQGNEALIEAYRKRGVIAVCNALPPRGRSRFVTVFVLSDGSVIREDSRITHEASREAGETNRGKK